MYPHNHNHPPQYIPPGHHNQDPPPQYIPPGNYNQPPQYIPPTSAPSAPPYVPPSGGYPPLPPSPGYPSYPYPPTPAHGPSNQRYYWSSGSYGSVPPLAVRAGVDKTGEPVFIGRAFHNGETVPGKIVPSHRCVYIPWGGAEVGKEHYDVLCAQESSWHNGEHGSVPDSAVQCGQTSEGETLFVGRVMHDGTLTPGKVQPSHGCIYIPYDGKELSFQEYEVLVVH